MHTQIFLVCGNFSASQCSYRYLPSCSAFLSDREGDLNERDRDIVGLEEGEEFQISGMIRKKL